MKGDIPDAEVVKAWMKNHVCTPRDGIPQSFIDELTQTAKCESEHIAPRNMV